MTRIEKLRNIGISAHIDSGKTTLTERMLYYCGRIHQIHEVRGSDGVGATMDSDPIERKRGITIQSAVTSVEWQEHTLQIIDTPGHVDFTVEVERSLRVLDGAVFVFCSVGGVQSQSFTVNRQMQRYGVPRIAFINKMDRVGADPARVVLEIRQQLKSNAVLLQLPIGRESDFSGVVDLVQMQAVYFDGQYGQVVRREPIPEPILETAKAARRQLLESLALLDDEIMLRLLSDEEPSQECVRSCIRRATVAHQLTPVLLGSAAKNKGVQELLDAVAYYLPAPVDRTVWAIDLRKPKDQQNEKLPLTVNPNDATVAMAYKSISDSYGVLTFVRVYQGRLERGQCYTNVRTGRKQRFSKLVQLHAAERTEIDSAEPGSLCAVVGLDAALGDTFVSGNLQVALESIHVPDPVLQLAIEPVRREDVDKLAKALERFRKQDPTFRSSTDQVSGQTLIAGMGQLHLEVVLQRLNDDYQCQVQVGRPQVAYKERPTRTVRFEHQLRKQNGGQGLYAKIVGRLEPLPMDASTVFEFADEVTGGRISRPFLTAINQGVREALSTGPLGQYPVVGVRVVIEDGVEHEKDSSELAFRRCAWEAIREVVYRQPAFELLEPIMELELEVPSEFQGTVAGALSRKRGNISATEDNGEMCRMRARVALAELLSFSNELRSLTQGKGTFTMSPLNYEAVPAKFASLLMAV